MIKNEPNPNVSGIDEGVTWFYKISGWIRYYWLPLAFMSLSTCCVCLSVYFSDTTYWYQRRVSQTLTVSNREGTILVDYPSMLQLGSSEEPRPITVELRWNTVSSGDLLATPPVRHNYTPTRTSVLVLFSSDERVSFVDPKGLPIPPMMIITPELGVGIGTLYVRYPAITPTATQTSIGLSVFTPSGEMLASWPKLMTVALESYSHAKWRHRLKPLVTTPVVSLISLALSGAAFVFKEWSLLSERERQRILAKIETLATFRSNSDDATLRYLEMRKRTRTFPPWQHPDIVRRLNQVFHETVEIEQLLDLAARKFADKQDDKALQYIDLVLERDPYHVVALSFSRILQTPQCGQECSIERMKELLESLRQVSSLVAGSGVERLAETLKSLQEQIQERKDPNNLEDLDLERLEVEARNLEEKFKTRRRINIWQWISEKKIPTHQTVVRRLGLDVNPFGYDHAELDSMLHEYGYHDIFDDIEDDRHTLIIGREGAGKTAAAFLLVDSAFAGRSYAFAAYGTLPHSAREYEDSLFVANVTALWIARYLTHNADEFFSLPEPRQYGVARLLSMWARSREHLALLLKRAGPDWGTQEKLVSKLTSLYNPISPDERLENLQDLLAEALPHGFNSLYVVLDSPAGPGFPYVEGVLQRMEKWLSRWSIPLLSKSVYLKIFLRGKWHDSLKTPPEFEVVTLKWDDEDLERMLDIRIRMAGSKKGIESMSAIVAPSVQEPAKRFVKAARGSPRQLVRLGNEMLRKYDELLRRGSESEFEGRIPADIFNAVVK